MKIVHEKYKSTRKYVDPVISEFQASFESAVDYNKELDNLLNKAQVGSNVSFCHCAHQFIIIIIQGSHSLEKSLNFKGSP